MRKEIDIDFENKLEELNIYIEENSEELHERVPHNPVISKNDEWVNENEWDELYEEMKSSKSMQSTKEIFEEFYKKPYDEITKDDIGECELIDWGPDVGGEVIE
ncbi:hypothetical protein CSX00_03800 [Pseudobutyrivibrio ruminis]|uniref:Uncharacterized protein n=1 Tax=Pseudobutyrivibrio ruminis TaxID=46206 RepID=A0A2G3ECM4_9FIRM|nr:hypothetical protein [Pseudobutyrivibrio ruminis]PHU41079.1 hypothetical protein CSX00_03800 [Pseudobutyrivibrio ruminis]